MSEPSPGVTSSSPRSDKGTQRPPAKARKKARSPKIVGENAAGRIVAIANQKGGVGKSTTAVSLGAALAELGYRILVVDLDPQGNASTGMGIRHEARDVTVYDVVVGEAPVDSAIVHTAVAGLDAVPSTIDLAGAEIELVSQFSRETRLKKALGEVAQSRYDFIFLDCPPSLGLLTINALTAAEELIVPIQCEYYALEGLGQLLRNVNLVQQNINPELRLSGIVMTMFDPRTKLSEQVVQEVRRFFGDVVYDVIIPRTVRLSEAPGFGQPITVYDPRSKGAECYRELAREVSERPRPDRPMPVFDELPTVVVQAPTREQDPMEPSPKASKAEARPEPEPADELEPVAATAPDPEPTAGERPVLERGDPEPTDAASTAASAQAEVVDEVDATGRLPAPPAPATTEPGDPEADLAKPSAEHPAGRSGNGPISSPVVAQPTTDVDIWDDDVDAISEPRVRAPREAVGPGSVPQRRVVVIGEDPEIDIEAGREPLVQVPGGSRPEGPDQPGNDIGATLHDGGGPKRRWRLFRKGGQ